MTTQRFVRGAVAETANRVHIQLRGLPRTALPTDVQRLCAQSKLENVKRVALDYRAFEPRGLAYVTLTSPTFMSKAVESLNDSILGGFTISAASSPPPLTPRRARGVDGRQEAAARGALPGDGPTAGITGNGRNVIITGLPGKMTSEGVKLWLKNFKLAGNTAEEKEINKIQPPGKVVSLLSKHLVRLATVSEAHRLVRRLHQTFYEPEVHGMRYPIRARIIY